MQMLLLLPLLLMMLFSLKWPISTKPASPSRGFRMMENQALVSHLLLPVVPCFSCYWLLLLLLLPAAAAAASAGSDVSCMAGLDEIVEATRGREIVSL